MNLIILKKLNLRFRDSHSMKFVMIFSLLFLSCNNKFKTNILKSYQPLLKSNNKVNSNVINEGYNFLNTTNFDAFIACKNDSLIASWGDVELPINTHSARKSIMSLLYGIAIGKGYLRLDQTLEELEIDDRIVPLTRVEKSCTIRDLLMSRSGIYIESPGETKEMKSNRPRRGQHKPGEFFYYNNWGFNVLGTIFEKQTKLTIGEAIEKWLAIPLGMKHFNKNFVVYKNEEYTEHRQYIIYLSTIDFARIGILMLNYGKWKGNQIVSRNWVEESTRPYSNCGEGNEPLNMYSYLWWNDTIHETIWATGWGGQFMIVDMKNKLVLVSRNDTKRTFIGQGLFLIQSKQGYRSEHQKLYELIKHSLKE